MELRCSTSPVLGTGLPPLDDISLTGVLSNSADGLQDMIGDRLPIGPTPSMRLTRPEYEIWSSVVSGMPSYRSLTKSTGSDIAYPALRLLDVLYGIGNLALLALSVWGVGASVFVSSADGSVAQVRHLAVQPLPVHS